MYNIFLHADSVTFNVTHTKSQSDTYMSTYAEYIHMK